MNKKFMLKNVSMVETIHKDNKTLMLINVDKFSEKLRKEFREQECDLSGYVNWHDFFFNAILPNFKIEFFKCLYLSNNGGIFSESDIEKIKKLDLKLFHANNKDFILYDPMSDEKYTYFHYVKEKMVMKISANFDEDVIYISPKKEENEI